MITFRTTVSWLAQDLVGGVSTERLQVGRTEQEPPSVLPTWNWVALETVTLLQQYPGVLRRHRIAHWGQKEACKATGTVCRRSEQGSCSEFLEGEVDRNGMTVCSGRNLATVECRVIWNPLLPGI